METGYLSEMDEKLAGVPKGKLLLERHTAEHDAPFLSEQLVSSSDGKGFAESWTVFPGVVLLHSYYRAKQYSFHHAPLQSVMQINHCRQGRIGWEMHDGTTVYLGAGDLSLHMMDACAESVISLPLGFYEGIAISVDLETLTHDPPEILREAGIKGQKLHEKFCNQNGHTAMPASTQIEHIFSELYVLPYDLQMPYFKLKVQELLLFLSMLDVSEEKQLDRYYSQQIETIKTIHTQLTQHLDRRYTIEELAKQYLINTSALKAVFKTVYGLPVASYMKEYRIKEAARMLRENSSSVSEIAAAVGYESQSKFTAAFKEVLQILPTAYRKQFQS